MQDRGKIRSDSRSRTAWLLFLAAAAFFLRGPVFVYPFFNGDEATYSAIAASILDGNLLYVSVVDHKPPLIYLTYALVFWLAGSASVAAAKAASILSVLATALIIGTICRSSGRPADEGRWAALAYVLFSAMGPGKDMLAANAEIFMMLPATAAVLLFVTCRRGTTLVLAGVLCACAFLYKFQGGAVLGGLACALLFDRESGWKIGLVRECCLAAGFFLPLAFLYLWYALSGNLASLWFWGWQFPATYAGLLALREVVYNAVIMSLQWGVPCSVLLYAAWKGARRLVRENELFPYPVMLFCWLFWSVLGVAAGGRFTLHYYIQLLPPLTLVAAPCFNHLFAGFPGLRDLGGALSSKISKRVIVFTLVPLALFWVANVYDHRLRPRVPHYTRIYSAVGTWLQRYGDPGDTLLVWGNSPEIYHFSKCRMGTRFVFCNYHSGKIWGTAYDEEGAGVSEKMQVDEAWNMLVADLKSRQPRWVVDAASGGLDRWAGHEAEHYPRLWQVLEKRYTLEATVADTRIYRRL